MTMPSGLGWNWYSRVRLQMSSQSATGRTARGVTPCLARVPMTCSRAALWRAILPCSTANSPSSGLKISKPAMLPVRTFLTGGSARRRSSASVVIRSSSARSVFKAFSYVRGSLRHDALRRFAVYHDLRGCCNGDLSLRKRVDLLITVVYPGEEPGSRLMSDSDQLRKYTADIVTSYLKNNHLEPERLHDLIDVVYRTLSKVTSPQTPSLAKIPVIAIRRSITSD